MSELVDKARQFLQTRQYAYKQTFNGPLAETVLRDLAQYGFADITTFHGDKDKMLYAEGRRSVWLRIQNHLNLSPADLWRLTNAGDE